METPQQMFDRLFPKEPEPLCGQILSPMGKFCEKHGTYPVPASRELYFRRLITLYMRVGYSEGDAGRLAAGNVRDGKLASLDEPRNRFGLVVRKKG